MNSNDAEPKTPKLIGLEERVKSAIRGLRAYHVGDLQLVLVEISRRHREKLVELRHLAYDETGHMFQLVIGGESASFTADFQEIESVFRASEDSARACGEGMSPLIPHGIVQVKRGNVLANTMWAYVEE